MENAAGNLNKRAKSFLLTPGVPKKRKLACETVRRWSTSEMNTMIEYMRDTVLNGFTIEKPTALGYWGEFLSKHHFPNCTSTLLRSKYRTMKDKYRKFDSWKNQTGQTADPDDVNNKMMKDCPYFEQLNEFLSENVNINPPGGVELGHAPNSEPNQYDEYNLEQNEERQHLQNSQDNDDFPVYEQTEESDDTDLRVDIVNSVTGLTATQVQDKVQSLYKKATKQSRMIDAFELKSRTKVNEIEHQVKVLEFDREKWCDEKDWKERQLKMDENREQHKIEMDKINASMESKKIDNDFQLQKIRLEKDMELQIKLAKIKKGLDVD